LESIVMQITENWQP